MYIILVYQQPKSEDNMIFNQVKFARQTNFTGRNGYFACSGIEVLHLNHNNSVMLSPLTSRGVVGRCDIEVPLENVPDLIAQLQALIPTVVTNNNME